MTERMVLVGLGNPDAEYRGTRHNLGRDVLQAFAATVGERSDLLFFYPPTFMNESGPTAAEFVRYHRVPADQILVAHDDLELLLGEVRLERGGSARGHNGVRSVQEALATQDFYRLRLGIGRPPENVAARAFVLERFTKEEAEAVAALVARAQEELQQFVTYPHQRPAG